MKTNEAWIESEYLILVKEILNSFCGGRGVTVYLFGSRAKGTAKKTADIDLALDAGGKKLPFGLISDIKYAFEESDIPYTVDIVDLNDIADSFMDAVKNDFMKIDYKI